MENEKKSNPALLSSMNQFVQSVENMNSTVLLPSRLMDIPGKIVEKRLTTDKAPEDLYAFYKMLNGIKEELVLGPGVVNIDYSEDEEKCLQNFRFHLQGLAQSLRNLTQGANVVTSRYQEDLGDGQKRSSPLLY